MLVFPNVVTSDQRREFHSKLIAELMEPMGIDHRLTTGIIHRYAIVSIITQGH